MSRPEWPSAFDANSRAIMRPNQAAPGRSKQLLKEVRRDSHDET